MEPAHPTRELLIDTALELFSEQGYRGTTVRRVEEAAGLTPGAGGLYRHFRSKEELLMAAVARYRDDVDRYLSRTPELLELGDARAELLLGAKLSLEFNERNHALLGVLLLEGRFVPAGAQQAFEAAWERAYRVYATWLRARLGETTEVDVDAIALQLYGSLTQYQIQEATFTRPPLSIESNRFIQAWADHWSGFIQSHRSS